MATADEKEIHTGQHGDYQWLTSSEDYMGTLVDLCPEVILGKYLAVTSIDSGVLWLTDRQRSTGWKCRGEVAYSSPIQSVDQLLYQRGGPDSPGYDEWYVFDRPANVEGAIIHGNPFVEPNIPGPGRIMIFVSQLGFRIDADDTVHEGHRHWFWEQIDRIKPESYIADGQDCLTFVTRKHEFLELVLSKLR